MKRLSIAISVIALFAQGCKEIPPPINLGVSAVATDTTYVVSPVPVADAHNVLVEEFTGQSCSNCPAGHATLDTAVKNDPAGRVIVISLFENDGSALTQPPAGAMNDFRNNIAKEIALSPIYNGGTNSFGGYPDAGIDRRPVSGNDWVAQNLWPGTITSYLTTADSINLSVSSTYTGTVATIVVSATYTQAVSTQQNLSVVIVEDSIIDFQEYPFGAIDSNYMFEGVFRDMVTTAPSGDPVLSTMATKEAGRFVQRVYSYTLPTVSPSIKAPHCRVIAFLNAPGTGGDYHVIQAAQCKLVGP